MTVKPHCPYRQAELLLEALAPDKMKVAFLIGAGCPSAIQVQNGASKQSLIPDVKRLTEIVVGKLRESKYKTGIDGILKMLSDNNNNQPNIEEILTHIRAWYEVIGAGNAQGLTKTILGEIDEEICKCITDVVKAPLPTTDTPYHQLATWIGGIRREQSVELFTPNYDLLIEQALEERGVPYFDGFVGARHTFFDLASMEQEKLPARWARVWKVHGSINWWRNDRGNVERRSSSEDGARQMIYPSHLKYYQSRRMPYLAMMDRLRAFLAGGQAVLVSCGYSFSDEHLNDIILQGLQSNPTACCFGLLFGDLSDSKGAVEKARAHSNLSLLAIDGAVIGTVEKSWRSDEKTDDPMHGSVVVTGEMTGRTSAPKEQCKFLLGDFAAFGEFLSRQLSHAQVMKSNENGT